MTRLLRQAGGGLGRGFWTLFSASFLANLSDGIFQIALPLLAVSLTNEPGLVAGVAVASRLPWLVFGSSPAPSPTVSIDAGR